MGDLKSIMLTFGSPSFLCLTIGLIDAANGMGINGDIISCLDLFF